MDVQTITGRSFAVYITPDELARRKISPRDVTADAALDILSPILGREGDFCLDLFPGRNDLLVFVRKCWGPPLFYAFSDFEDLVSAVHACRADAPSSLYYREGTYILAVRRTDCGSSLSAFSEFGDELDLPPDYSLYLAEHAKLILPKGALNIIRAFFDK